jgi:gluconokinase
LDFGTSSVRALACDSRGEPIDGLEARRQVHPHQDEHGAGELSAPAYLEALIGCLDDLTGTGRLTDVTKVATSSQWHSVLAWDSDGRAGSPVLTWLDTRATTAAQPADPEAFHRRTGSWVHPLYWNAKIVWLRTELGSRASRFAGLTEFIRAVLLGEPAMSTSMASGTGMLDVHTGKWDAEAMEIAGVNATALPEVSDEPARLTAGYARRWPALARADWTPATGDGAASTVGAGCPDGTVGVTVGTSAAIRVAHPAQSAPQLSPELWRYRVDASRVLTGAAISSGGVLHEWLTNLLGRSVRDPIEPPGVASAGLTMLPMHAGSRPPLMLPAGSGVLAGMALTTSAEQLVAATYEGVVFELRRALQILDAEFETRLPVVVGGGAVAASPWWRQAIGAGFDRDVRFQLDPEVGARGAAMLALGLPAEPPGDATTVEAEHAQAMKAAGARYDELRARLLG